MPGLHLSIEALGWVATAVFVASYFFKKPETLVRVQIAGALLWVVYGALVHAAPVIAANLLVVGAAALKGRRPAQRPVQPLPVE
jgi:hypothetical protein